MEALHSHLTTGEQSGGHKPPQPGSPQPRSPSQKNPPQSSQSKQQTHDTSQQHKQPKRQPPERKRLRHQRQSVDSDTGVESKRPEPASQRAGRGSSGPQGPSPSTPSRSAQTRPTEEGKEAIPKQKRERKPQRPGKYVCSYCGRACAKPSVLQKHIRSHTGERPYPCGPCGFSFKTKSNLYKHRKSHTHRVKAGLATAEQKASEEPATESEDESRQLSSAASMDRQGSVCVNKNIDSERSKEPSSGMDDSFAVKKRLAMRLSRGKRGPLDSSDEKSSSLILASRGSTESGYFSRSESTEQSQDSPPNTSAKSYAEIILGKYGRLGHLQRMSRHHNQQPSGQEENNIPFTVPKKQVIDHITKLITINEAVVDTSKIDSVKPRRFSLSRRSSSESLKASSLKEPLLNSLKVAEPRFQSSGSITMGVPCDKFHHQSLNVSSLAGQTPTAPLLRSQSMPSAASSTDASRAGPRSFRLSQSFDEQKASESHLYRRYGVLKRQPAIELPIGAELPKEELPVSQLHYHHHMPAVPDHKQCQLQPYECESCGTGCKDWEGYKTHKQSLCLAQRTLESEIAICQLDRPNLTPHLMRPGALTIRKRRKEESFELDDPASPLATSLPVFSSSVPNRDESHTCCESPSTTAWSQVEKSGRSSSKGFSVIQHTSSFERQETLCPDNKVLDEVQPRFPSDKESRKQSQQTPVKPAARKLVRQHNVQVPEILVTEDSNTASVSVSLRVPASIPKQTERTEEFQWPQRSPTLAQLPIEKLPPKKKRLRLAEAAQSSGESSFDSTSLPRSPSQDSSASYASSRSASFEESNRLDMETAGTTTPLRRSRAPHTLPIPGLHPHREMRRSASEQAPHDPPHSVLMAETRSKSFDYSCLSPERSAAGWRERRKCLLMRHTVVRDPEEEEQPSKCGSLKMNPSHPGPSPEPTSSSTLSRASPGPLHLSHPPASALSTDVISCNPTPLSQSVQSTRSLDVLPIHNPAHEPLPLAKLIQSGQCSSISIHPVSPQSAQFPTGAARAHYLTMSTGLKLKIPSQAHGAPELTLPSQMALRQPNITPSSEMLRPAVSQALAVRLHADTVSPARAIYTTMSQTMCSRSQEPMCSALNIGTTEYKIPMTMPLDSQMGSMEGFRSSGSGGSKRMLSPSSSIELSPESQQQQKRVKEHEQEKEEERFADDAEAVTEEKQSPPPPASHTGPSFPSLQSTTSFSWCYLNYIKPNPSIQDEQQPSVYSSWSTSEFDPNPPGLSSKTAMSLLQCKQSSSPSIYTMSAMSSSTIETPQQPSDAAKPCSSEVHDTVTACDRGQAQTKDDEWSSEGRGNILEDKEDGEPPSSNQDGEPSRIWVCEGGYRSNEEYVYVWGRGRGRYVCEECGIRCRKPSMLQKHIRLHTDARPYVCKHCNFAFKTKGNLTKHLKSKTHGKKSHEWPIAGCSLDDTEADEGISEDCPGWPETQEDHQYSDLEETDEEEDEDDDNDDDGEDDNEEPWYRPSPHSPSTHKLTSLPDRPGELEPSLSSEPKGPERAYPVFPTSMKRDAELTPGASSSGAHIPSPGTPSPGQRQSPARTLSQNSNLSAQHSPSLGVQPSPALQQVPPPSSLSPSSCHVPHSAGTQPSPVRVLSPGGSPPGSPAPCLVGSSAPHRPSPPRHTPSDASVDQAGCFTPITRLRTQLVQGSRPPHLLPRPGFPQGLQGLLSHLPLHSQQPARTPSFMIPIGGIHMVQPRTSPLYSLVRSPVTAPAPYGPGGEQGAWTAGLKNNLLGRCPSPKRQDTLREAGPSLHTSHQDHRVKDRKCPSRVCLGTRAAASPGEESEPCCSTQGDSSHAHAPGVTHTHTLKE